MATPKTGAAMPRLKPSNGPQGQLELGIEVAKSVWFDELRALEIFLEAARRYREGIGFYHGVRQIQPQHLYTPAVLKEGGGRELANFFFFLAMSQRGGLNSDDSIRITNAVWRVHPELFEPSVAAGLTAEEITRCIQGVAERFYAKGLNGDRERKAGSLSFKLHEFALHWQKNAHVLAKYWRGDVRTVFIRQRIFEEYFISIARGSNGSRGQENLAGFHGMRRKIFALLCFWLIEFDLVPEFHIPLVVDFHVVRALLELGVIKVDWKKLGPGNPKIAARLRPEPLWEYDSVHVHESLVNQVVAWSYGFLERHNLSPFDVHNALWNLSRVLCASYHGNSGKTVKRPDEQGKAHTVTERLVDSKRLADLASWPKGYRDLCRFCPFERRCGIAIPSGPYYDWGVMVRAGDHVVYPGREPTLDGVPWYDMPIVVLRRRNNLPAVLDIVPAPEAPKEAHAQLTFFDPSA